MRHMTRNEKKRRRIRRMAAWTSSFIVILSSAAMLLTITVSGDSFPESPEKQDEKPSVAVEKQVEETDNKDQEDDIYGYDENQMIEDAILEKANKIENCRITYYCVERYPHICGTGNGITASGLEVTPYVSCAVDPSVIPLGSDVLVDFGDGDIRYYRADDTGPKGKHIDLAVQTHDEATEMGTTIATVYWAETGW